MRITRRTRKQITAEAVDWFLQFRDGVGAEQDRQTFSEWLLRSPAHVEEYLQVSSSWCTLDIGAEGDLEPDALVAEAKKHHETDNVVRLPPRFGRRLLPESGASGHRFSGKHGWSSLAAAAMLGIVSWVTYLSWHFPKTFQTMVGEERSFTLQDGSVVFLNTNSKVRVAWFSTERHIDLVRGEARFRVAKDASRPFTVATETAAVRALGTVFNVRADRATTQVAVLEGQVEVTAAPAQDIVGSAHAPAEEGSVPVPPRPVARVRLAAGERAAVTNLGIQTNTGPAIESVMAWTERRLVFRDQPLTAVIDEFNRYLMQPLVLDDPDLAAVKISGVFDLNDTESLIAYLGAYETVQVERKTDGSQHLFRGSAGVHAKK
jgi:transmembrane sensor